MESTDFTKSIDPTDQLQQLRRDVRWTMREIRRAKSSFEQLIKAMQYNELCSCCQFNKKQVGKALGDRS